MEMVGNVPVASVTSLSSLAVRYKVRRLSGEHCSSWLMNYGDARYGSEELVVCMPPARLCNLFVSTSCVSLKLYFVLKLLMNAYKWSFNHKRNCEISSEGLTKVNIPLTLFSASSGSGSSYARAESSHAARRTTSPSLFFLPTDSRKLGLVTGWGWELNGRSNPVPDVQQSKRAF